MRALVAEGWSDLTSMHEMVLHANEKAPFSKSLTKPQHERDHSQGKLKAKTNKRGHTHTYTIFMLAMIAFEKISNISLFLGSSIIQTRMHPTIGFEVFMGG